MTINKKGGIFQKRSRNFGDFESFEWKTLRLLWNIFGENPRFEDLSCVAVREEDK